jgi:hypothetical protein
METKPSQIAEADELEFDLQEAIARRHRAAELFGAPDQDDEFDATDD